MADKALSSLTDTGVVSGDVVYGVRGGNSRAIILKGAAGQDTGVFLSDSGVFLSDTGPFLSDTGGRINDTGRFAAGDSGYLFDDRANTLKKGFDTTDYNAGTKSSGTFTPDPANGNNQYYTNNGAHTLAPPNSSTTVIILMTNGASAGSVTTSGFTKVTGSSFTTTSGHKFMCYISRCNAVSHLHVQAMQ